jgi:hypothetical protein
MQKITELKQGDAIYGFSQSQVLQYKYLCVHPTGGGNYHILIDACEEPLRIYKDRLQAILDKNLKTYHAAELALADQLEQSARRLRSEPKSL